MQSSGSINPFALNSPGSETGPRMTILSGEGRKAHAGPEPASPCCLVFPEKGEDAIIEYVRLFCYFCNVTQNEYSE